MIERSLDQVFDDGGDDSSDEPEEPTLLKASSGHSLFLHDDGRDDTAIHLSLQEDTSFRMKPALSLTNPPKRKSLLEQIDEDHPGSRSERARPRRSLPASLAASALSALKDERPPVRVVRTNSAPFVKADGDELSPEEAPETPETPPAVDLNALEDGSNELGWRWLRNAQDAATQASKRGSGIWVPGDKAAPHAQCVSLQDPSVVVPRSLAPSQTQETDIPLPLPGLSSPEEDVAPNRRRLRRANPPVPAQPRVRTRAKTRRDFVAAAGQNVSLDHQRESSPIIMPVSPHLVLQRGPPQRQNAQHSPPQQAVAHPQLPPAQQLETHSGMMGCMQMQWMPVPTTMDCSMQLPVHYQMGVMPPMLLPATGNALQGCMQLPASYQYQVPQMMGHMGQPAWYHSAPPATMSSASLHQVQAPQGQVHPGWAPPSPAAAAASDPGRAAPKIAFGQLASLAMDPKGSRMLQAEMPRMSRSHFARARTELAPHLYALSKHTFGNYLVSRLATLEAMHEAIADAFKGHLLELLCHAQGSRVVQAFLSAQPCSTALKCVKELSGHVPECALDTHGSWGICVAFERTRAPFILDEVAENVCELSIQQHGCRVVQSVMQAAANAGMELRPAVSGIIRGDVVHLASHRFANYAVQVALRQGPADQREYMLSLLLPELLKLSSNKHGSNVAEVMLAKASDAQVEHVTDAIFAREADLTQLMGDAFGNYVLQTLLRRIDDPERRARALSKVRATTTASNYGRSILSRLGISDADLGQL